MREAISEAKSSLMMREASNQRPSEAITSNQQGEKQTTILLGPH